MSAKPHGRRRDLPPALAELALAMCAIVGALAIGAALIASAGLDPLNAYLNLWNGAFGTIRATAETLVTFSPMSICALAVLVGFRAGFFTIGVDGQLYIGALTATVAALYLPALPSAAMIPLVMMAGMLGGMAWALIAGLLKIRFGVNEVISTIMLNNIAGLFIDYMVRGPIRAPQTELHYTSLIPETSWLPVILDRTRLHSGVVLPLLCAALVYALLWRMTVGYRIRVVGANPTAARHAGIDVGQTLLAAVAVSGALAGLAGAVEVQGVFHRLQAGIAGDVGYTAIPVALVGKTLPGTTLLAALFFSALTVGATMMQLKSKVPLPMVSMLQGLVILFVVGSEAFKGRLAGHGLRQLLGAGREKRS
jgi:simple sugar transport system permease protein